MIRITKRLLSLALAILMVATLLPFNVFAEETWTEVATFEEFQAALATGGNIRLTASFTGTAKVEVTKATVIDFNGNTYTSYNGAYDSFYVKSSLTLKDTSAEGKGGIYLKSAKDSAYQLIRNSNTLVIENGVYTVDNAHGSLPYVVYSWGTCTINGGTFTMNATGTASGGYVASNTSSGKMTINGGTFIANGAGSSSVRALYNEANHDSKNGVLTVNGGTYTVTSSGSGVAYGMTNNNRGQLTIKAATISVTHTGTGNAYGIYSNATKTNSELKVEGGSIAVSGNATVYGISLVSSSTAKLTIPAEAKAVTVTAHSESSSSYGIDSRGVTNLHSPLLTVTATNNAGKDADRYAYAVYNNRTIRISAGSFSGIAKNPEATKAQGIGYNGSSATDVVCDAEISGGTFYGSSTKYNGSGIVGTSNTVLTVNGNPTVSGTGKAIHAYKGNITINGGTYSSTHTEYCIEVTTGNLTINSGTFEVPQAKMIRNSGTLTINGGTFKSRISTISNGGTLSITGGTFTGANGKGMIDVYKYLDTTKYGQDYNGKVVAAADAGARFAVTVGDTTTEYGSIVAMAAAVNADTTGKAKVKLLQDVHFADSQDFAYSLDLDLNGHTWLQSRGSAINVKNLGSENAITKIHNGTVISNCTSVPVSVYQGAIQLDDLVVYGCSTMPVCYYAPNGDYAADCHIKNSTLITSRYYAFSFRSNKTVQTNMDILIEDSNLVSLYNGAKGGEIFFAGYADTTGQYTLGKGVNLYHVYNTNNLQRQEGLDAGKEAVKAVAAEGYTIHGRQAAAQYSDINAILAQVGTIAGFTEGVSVYQDNTPWTTTPSLYKVSTNHTFVDGTCSCGATDSRPAATIGEQTYETVTAALEASKAGDVVVLQKPVNDETADLLVEEGVTLDLNGQNVTVGTLTSFGSLVDGDMGGKALIKAKNMLSESGFLPIYDAENGGYRVFDYQVISLGHKTVNEDSVKFGFRLTLNNADGYALLAKADSGVSMKIQVACSGATSFTFAYPIQAATLQTFGQAMAAGRTTSAITLTVSGLYVLGDNGNISMTPAFASDLGMVAAGSGASWTAAN